MNVIRTDPSQKKEREIKKKPNANIYQTVREGVKKLRRTEGNENIPCAGVIKGTPSFTPSRLQWTNRRSSTCSNNDSMSVAQILSKNNGSSWSSNYLTARADENISRSSYVYDERLFFQSEVQVSDQYSNPDVGIGGLYTERAENDGNVGFFDNIQYNATWNSPCDRENVIPEEENAMSDEHMELPLPGEEPANHEDGEFFSLEHVLQNNPSTSHQSDDIAVDQRLTSVLPSTSNNGFDFLFKTPAPPLKSRSIARSEEYYKAIFNTPLRVRELPRLSTPLFSPALRSSATSSTFSKTTPSFGETRTTKSTREPTSSTLDSAVIVSLTEGRGYAVGEVGFAFINLNEPTLALSQISDFQTYFKTITKINLFNPAEIIVPDTFLNEKNTSDLYKQVTEHFPTVKLVALKRVFFNSEQGLDDIRALCLPECSPVDSITLHKYYALAATAALLKYIEHAHNTIYAKKSIKVCYEGAMGLVSLDMSTARRLELVKTHGDMINPEKYSLLGIMDSTVTIGGKRRLRSEVLQPPASRTVIEQRLDVVSFLVSNPSFLAALQGVLVQFSNVEKLMWLCRKLPNFKQEKKTNETMTNYVLLLKDSLENISSLRDLLSESENDLLIKIRDELADQRYQAMVNLISQKIHHDAKPIKNYQGAEVNRCFSIKEKVNALLDVARTTYSKLIQEIQDLITRLSSEHNIPMRMTQSAELGFHGQYTLPKNSEILGSQIPTVFRAVKIKGNVCHLSTDEILTLNNRVRKAVQEIQLISNVVLFELVKNLRPSIGCLYNLCENVALLDVVCSLAKYSLTSNFVRPTFGDQLNVQGGRHPILDYMEPIKPTPNSVFASTKKNMNIITGPNMSGKSVYLLQIALLQVMAQVGSFVPADSAEFRITDHIYFRKNDSECVENAASSFTLEVKEIMYCLNTMTDRSLILLDEMCTGTNSEGATAMAWAICEDLLCRPAFTFLTTHLHFLTSLEKIFLSVTNYQMEVIERPQPDSKYSPLTYTHRLLPGVTEIMHYGLRLLMTTSLPQSMKDDAVRVVEALEKKRANCLTVATMVPIDVQAMMARVDKLEKFMLDMYLLTKSDEYSVESLQEMQRFAVDNIVVQELRSIVLKEPGTPQPSDRINRNIENVSSISRGSDVKRQFESGKSSSTGYLIEATPMEHNFDITPIAMPAPDDPGPGPSGLQPASEMDSESDSDDYEYSVSSQLTGQVSPAVSRFDHSSSHSSV